MLPFKSRARLSRRTRLELKLSRPGAAGKHPIVLGQRRQFSARKTSEAFVPPKPKELDKAA